LKPPCRRERSVGIARISLFEVRREPHLPT
jgi:hypothetical protein